MWVLKSFSKEVVAGPFKSQTEMAKKLGLSHQFVNRQIRKYNFRFTLDGQTVVAVQEKEFTGDGKRGSDKDEFAFRLGVSQNAVEKVFAKHKSGVLETPQGKVKIQKLKPGEKPALPAIRVLWNEDMEKKDFVSFASAAKELKIDSKTISSAIKAGRNSFTRKSDGQKFTFEIPKENTPSRKKPKPPSEEQKANKAEAVRQAVIKSEVMKFYGERVSNSLTSYPKMVEQLENFWPGILENIRSKVVLKEQEPGSSGEKKPPEACFSTPPKGVQPPIPAPRRKNLPPPIPAPRPRGAQPPIPAPRKKVSFAALPESGEESEEETDSVELRDFKTWEILEKKYSDWWCKETVGQRDDTIMVLFHPVSGEYVKVQNYQNIEEFFQQRGFSSDLTEKLFEEKKRAGELVFSACRGGKRQTWFRLILTKRDSTDMSYEERQQVLQDFKEQERIRQARREQMEKQWAAREEKQTPQELEELRERRRALKKQEEERQQKRKEEEEKERAAREKCKPPPEEVVEIRNSGQKINFQNSHNVSITTFESPKTFAAYIRSGLRQKIFWAGAKNRQTVVIDNHEVYLPDLVKEIIVCHIREKMWKEGDYEGMKRWFEPVLGILSGKNPKASITKPVIFLRNVRNLEPMEIAEITKKLATMI